METVAVTVRAFEPTRLVARRVAAGLSRAELAGLAGLASEVLACYEDGRNTPNSEVVARLASALNCEAEELAELPGGYETLADLRVAAGLTVEHVAGLLRGVAADPGTAWPAAQVDALERGCPMDQQSLRDPELTGRLVAALAKTYGVPVRMVLDAWMRTRPGDPAPVLRNPSTRARSSAPLTVWESLNERQQAYLEEIMREDRMTETEMWMRRLQRLPVPPAAQWRRLPLSSLRSAQSLVGYTRLQERLRRRGLHDPGAGQTVHALERRGLLVVSEEPVDHPVAGQVVQVSVRLTRGGRAAAQAGLGEPPRQAPGEHLLSEWLWGVLVRVAAAGPDGLNSDALAGRSLFFIAVGYRSKPGGRPSRGFIDAVAVSAPGDTHVAEYRWQLTSLGRRHLAEYLEVYRQLYPLVDTDGLSGSPGGPAAP